MDCLGVSLPNSRQLARAEITFAISWGKIHFAWRDLQGKLLADLVAVIAAFGLADLQGSYIQPQDHAAIP